MKSHCSFPRKRKQLAVDKAKNRGIIAEQWMKDNKLTAETMPEFKRLMKKADKDFEYGER